MGGQKQPQVIDRSIPKRRMLVEGAISDIQRAFGVELNEYEHPLNGRFRGRAGEVQVPTELFGTIQGVFGLDTRRVGHPRNRRGRLAPVRTETLIAKRAGKGTDRAALPDISSQFPGAFFPPQVASLYNYPSNLDGSGQNVAIFAFNLKAAIEKVSRR